MDDIKITPKRSRFTTFIHTKAFFIPAMIACFTLSIIWGDPGYYLAIAIVITTLFATRWDLSAFGMQKANQGILIIQAILISIVLFLSIDMLLQPLMESLLGKPDLSNFDGLKGNVAAYIIFMAFMWVFAAFGEELFYRGYLMKRMAEFMGNTRTQWILSALISGVFFGLAHRYQGNAGMLVAGLMGVILGLIFIRKRNLWLLIWIHGIYDTIGITFIFLDKYDWVTGLFTVTG